MLNQFSNLSCYEEFEIRSALTGISKIDVLNKIGHKVDNYYFFVSNDGIFNWFDLEGNHIKDPCILKEIKKEHILENITKCVIPNSIISIGDYAFLGCKALKEINIPDSVTSIGNEVFIGCKSLKEITIPNSVTHISIWTFAHCTSSYCDSLKEVVFKGKTLDEVKQMENYPFGIADENVFKFS